MTTRSEKLSAEEPATRQEALAELVPAVEALARLAEGRSVSLEQTAEDLRSVVDHFTAAGGSFQSESVPALLGAFLTDGQKERLSAVFQDWRHPSP